MIKITLQDTLDELDVTIHKLSVEYKIRSSTLYKIISGETRQIRFDTLEVILNSINDYAQNIGIDKIYTVTDIIDYEYERGE